MSTHLFEPHVRADQRRYSTADFDGGHDGQYYIIPAESLPLLDPLRLIPIIGQPLYDLLEPDTS